MLIREARATDAAACAELYAPYVRDTAITFELDEPDPAEFARRIADAQQAHAWLVAEQEGRVVGYAYGSQFKARAAYRYSCEVSVYLELGLRRAGVGRALYGALLPRLAGLGYRMAVAGMTLPNDASAGFHRAFGFEEVGTFRRIGWKLDSWHDVAFLQRPLGPSAPGPGPSSGATAVEWRAMSRHSAPERATRVGGVGQGGVGGGLANE